MTRAVFISYSQADRDSAYELVARVEISSIQCWIAPRDIAPSAEWAAEIIDAISAAAVMVLVFSADSNSSPQVRREVERAVHKRLPVIAFRIDDVLPEKSLEYFLSAQHWLDAFIAPREAHYQKLIHHLQRILESGSGTPPIMTERGSASTHSAAVLSQLERQLAIRLGPVARILVQRAASRASRTCAFGSPRNSDRNQSGVPSWQALRTSAKARVPETARKASHGHIDSKNLDPGSVQQPQLIPRASMAKEPDYRAARGPKCPPEM